MRSKPNDEALIEYSSTQETTDRAPSTISPPCHRGSILMLLSSFFLYEGDVLHGGGRDLFFFRPENFHFLRSSPSPSQSYLKHQRSRIRL